MVCATSVDGDVRVLLDSYREQVKEALGITTLPYASYACRDSDLSSFPVECNSQAWSGTYAAYLHAWVNEEQHRAYLSIVVSHLHPINPPLLPLAPDGPAAPPTDETIDESAPFEDPLRIIEGSRLIDEPLPTANYTGYAAVLEVTVTRSQSCAVTPPSFRQRIHRMRTSGATTASSCSGTRAPVARLLYASAVAVIGDPTFIRVTYAPD